jgi:hypothetical protein
VPRRSIVQLQIRRFDLVDAARWLDSYAPKSLFIPERDLESRQKAQRLALVLRKAAMRRRQGETGTVNLQRADAEWLASLQPSGLLSKTPLPWVVANLAAQCRLKTGGGRVGRPRLTLDAISARVEGEVAVEGRHQKRLRRRLRYERELLAFPTSLFSGCK